MLPHGVHERVDPGFKVGGFLVRLDNDSQALDTVGSANSTEDDIAQLLLGPQDIEARFVYDLSKQL